MITKSSRRGGRIALLAGAPLLLAACATDMAADRGAGSGAGLFGASGTLGATSLVDTSGAAWQATVERSYTSAAGNDCAMVTLMPLSGGLPIHRALCVDNGRLVVAAPLTLAPGEADPRFAPVAAPAAPTSETAPANPAPFSQRSPS
ncbi:hypothetical protein [Zavarzinia aquatilis]|uniref:Uncharacterized protein n=1 Tax=Zavarzinia aquatilis TaxID=2211142 RepID=A0A317E2D7_9PROT|nr:hypothetical protein [Zavarzinia aquatilis]PWR21257.1 hypothetical protein DKG74_14780 [Zavarzinia aquatilis]